MKLDVLKLLSFHIYNFLNNTVSTLVHKDGATSIGKQRPTNVTLYKHHCIFYWTCLSGDVPLQPHRTWQVGVGFSNTVTILSVSQLRVHGEHMLKKQSFHLRITPLTTAHCSAH